MFCKASVTRWDWTAALDTPDDAGMRLWIDVTTPLSDTRLRRPLTTVLQTVVPSALPVVRDLVRDPRFKTRHVVSPRFARHAFTFLFPIIRRVLGALRHPDGMRRQADAQVEAFLREQETQAAGAHTFDERLDVIEHGLAQVFPQGPLVYAPIVAGGFLSLLLIRRLAASEADERNLALELTRGLPHNVTTEMNLDLWARSQRIRADEPSRRVLEHESASSLANRYAQRALPPVAQHELDEFLAHYGMRGAAEIDLGRSRWRQDPTALLNLLKSYLEMNDPNAAPDVVFARGAQAAEVRMNEFIVRLRRTRMGRIKVRLAQAAFLRVRALLGVRESPKLAIIRAYGIYRELLLQCGEELVRGGDIAQVDDVFFLTLQELRQRILLDPLASNAAGWRPLVTARRAEYQREQLRSNLPFLLTSDGDTFYDVPQESGPNDLIGEPVSPGVVEGTVHVVLDPRGAQLQPGEILVCPATDPGWTPLFLAAGGLVMEVGGLVTHGSVVAREYGIPAVVGVVHATQRLTSGQRVRVDGSHGRVTILENVAAENS